jgi:hypothetical protein
MENITNLDYLYEEIQAQILEIDSKLEAYGDDTIFERLRLYEAKLELQRIFAKLKNEHIEQIGVA